MDKRTIIFNLTTGQQNKLKLFTLHPKKPWVAIVTLNNTFSLWNYQQKILIKSFNCNTLDQSGNLDIKQLLFYDKYCLAYQNESLNSMRNNVVFATNFKIFFYDYITDGIKQINQTQIQKKIIKKICPYSQTKICVGLSDGSFKIYDNRDTIQNSMLTTTIKGYHTKPITNLFTYCQNANQTPRIITLSNIDGQMACWNVANILNSAKQNIQYNPSFKFERQNGPKGEQIKCFQYDRENYKILTLSDNWISIWSTMTGIQLKRIKNSLRFKQILFFNHFSYGTNSLLGINEGNSLVQISKLFSNGNLTIQDQINLKNLIKQHNDCSIQHIYNLPSNPSQIFIQTASGLIALQINATYRPVYGFNMAYITNLSTINSKQFIIKSENRINNQISKDKINKIKFQKDILFNCFYLSVDSQWIYFNLLEIQIDNVLYEYRKFKFIKIDQSSMISLSQGTQSIIESSYDGKSFFIFNKSLSYYEVYTVIEQKDKNDLLQTNEFQNDSLNFYSKVEIKTKGFCRDIVWHQYKNQFAAICAFDKKSQIITYQTNKQKKSIFKGKNAQKVSQILTGQIDHWCACIFEKSNKSNKYILIEKSTPIKTQLYRIFNLGTIYGYSSKQKSPTETIECFSEDKNMLKQIQGIGFFPLKVYVSYCQTYQIYVYQTYFIIFKIQQNGYYGYHLTINERIKQGMFWQKFFIFATKNETYFLQMTSSSKILIKIGDISPTVVFERNKSSFKTQQIDDLQPQLNIMPQGQLQFLTIVNFHLLILNHNQNVFLFPLKNNPYIQFCIQMTCGAQDRLFELYNKSSKEIQKIMKQTLSQHGISLPNVQSAATHNNLMKEDINLLIF